MNRLPHIAVLFAAAVLVAADKKPEKAKESAPSATQIQQWIKQLGDNSFKVREEATRNLIKAGEIAFDAVTKASKSKDAEVKYRALKIIKLIGKQLEKAAIAYFKKLGGKVTVDQKSLGKPVTELYLWKIKITDAGLVHLKGLTNLNSLNLNDTKVTDAGLEHLQGLSKLRSLYLRKTDVTDAGLAHLKGLTKLQYLVLEGTKITASGLVHLKGLTKLRFLCLQKTDVTDAGLVHLKGLTSLPELWLGDTKVTQAGIEKLQKTLPNCNISQIYKIDPFAD